MWLIFILIYAGLGLLAFCNFREGHEATAALWLLLALAIRVEERKMRE